MIPRDGATFRAQRILEDGEAVVRAINETEMAHESAKSLAFSWVSTFATAGTDVECLSIQNDNTSKVLVIEEVILAADGVAVFTVGNITSGTPGGTALVPTCLNRAAVKTSQDTAFGNNAVTGTTVVNAMYSIPVIANTAYTLTPRGAIELGNGDQWGISCSTSVTVYLTALGYFVNPEEL